jgi:hypothetical protein
MDGSAVAHFVAEATKCRGRLGTPLKLRPSRESGWRTSRIENQLSSHASLELRTSNIFEERAFPIFPNFPDFLWQGGLFKSYNEFLVFVSEG